MTGRIHARAALKMAQEFRAICHEERRLWGAELPRDSRADLWASRAEAMAAFEDWLKDERGAR